MKDSPDLHQARAPVSHEISGPETGKLKWVAKMGKWVS